MLMKTIGQRIREARKSAGLNQPELAAKCGWTQSRISNYERGERQPGLPDLTVIAKVLHIPTQSLAFDSHGGEQNLTAEDIKQPAKEVLVMENASWYGGFEVWDSKTPLSPDDAALPFYMEVELAAGSGSEVQMLTDGPKLRFAKSTLRNAGVQQEHAACVKVSGDSMEPALPDGSVVGIDMINKTVKDGKMYAINHDGLLRVKLLYRLPGGGLRVRSFNTLEYPDENYSAEDASTIQVIGKVFWSSAMW